MDGQEPPRERMMVEPGFPSLTTVVEPRFLHGQFVVEQGLPHEITAAEQGLPHPVSTVEHGSLPSRDSGVMDEDIQRLERGVMAYHLTAVSQLRVSTRSTMKTRASRT